MTGLALPSVEQQMMQHSRQSGRQSALTVKVPALRQARDFLKGTIFALS